MATPSTSAPRSLLSPPATTPPPAAPPQPYRSTLRPSRSYLVSSIGTKVVIGATGLLLFTYLVLHLAGNILVFFGPATFNGYSHLLVANPLIIPVELGLAAIFLIHVYKAVTNFIANRRARPVRYYKSVWTGKPSRKGLASTTMIISGLIVLAFVVVHLMQYKFGRQYLVAPGQPDAGIRDLYRLEVEVFGNPLNVGFYALCLVVVGSHLWHGIASAFDSLGVDHPRYTPWVLRLGKAVAVIIAGGFLTIPLWSFFFTRHAFAS